MDTELVAFAAFGIGSQVVLVAFFACRRWAPKLAGRYGPIAYAFGLLGLAVGAWLAISGASWRLFAGPVIFSVWAAYGAWVDLFRRIDWRLRVRWNVLGPYLTLYLAAQMFLWWPLWDYWRVGWTVYLVLFVANTALNLAGHFGPSSAIPSKPRATD